MRRKVLLARTVTLVVLVLIGLAYAFSQWAATESGIVSQTESSLKNESSRTKILEALDIAERFSKSGKTEAAEKIAVAADQALKLKALDSAARAKYCIELAGDLQKRGDKLQAARYCIKSLTAMREQVDSGKSVPELALLDEAAQIISQSKTGLSDGDLQSLLLLVRRFSSSLVNAEFSAPLDLCLENISRTNPPASLEFLSCLYCKEELLAKQAKLKELQALMKTSGDCLSRLSSSASAPAFDLVPLHLLKLAAFLYSEHPDFASGLMDRAAIAIASVDTTNLDDESKKRLADCYKNLSELCLDNSRNKEAVNYSRKAVELRSLQDAQSCECVRQLVKSLSADGNYREAEPLALSALKFFKGQDKNFPGLTELRTSCAYAYFDVLVALKRNYQAVGVLDDEIRRQKKLLPATADSLISIYSKLADYHIDRDEYRLAAQSAKQINGLLKYLSESKKVDTCMLLISYGQRAHNSDLTVEASMNALASIKKNGSSLKQAWLSGLCQALDSLQKSGATDTYSQALECVKAGFVQQLNDPGADPAVLADVINQLGTSGEERTADGLRSEAQEKLSAGKAEAFLARSMDFVVTGEKESAQYEEPLNSIKVFLDMAHNMQNKDDESAFKYAFEVLKISELLLSKNPQLKAQLFGDLDEAAALISASKKGLNPEQTKIVAQLCKDERGEIEKSGKTGVIDLLLLSEARNNLSPDGKSLSLIITKSEILAKKGQVSLLDSHINKYRNDIQEAKDNRVDLAAFYLGLADSLLQAKEQLAARRYLGTARRALEDNTSMQSKGAENSSPVVSPGEAQIWNRLALSFSKLGETQSALLCARRSMALRPNKDAGSVSTGLILVDGLIDTGNLAEAETQANELLRLARIGNPAADNFALRTSCIKRLLRIYREGHKDAESVSLLKYELKERQSNPQTRPIQSAELYRDLGYLYLQAQDGASLYECLNQLKQIRADLAPQDMNYWDRSALSKDIVYFATVVRQPKLAAEAIADLDRSKSLDKAQALRAPEKWWQSGLSVLKKSGEDASYNTFLDFVRAGFRQETQKPNADPLFLASVLNDLIGLQEEKSVLLLREQAKRRLSEAAYKNMSAELKGLPENVEQSSGESPAKEAGVGDAKQSKPEKDSGRLDLGD